MKRAAFLLLLLPSLARPETVITASIDRDTITVGDPIALTIRASAPAGETPAIPQFPEGMLGPFSILGQSPVQEETRDGVRTAVLALRITAFRTGAMEVPALRPDGSEAGTTPIPVTVLSVGLDPSGAPRDVKKPISLGRNWFRTLLPAVIVLLIAAAALLLYLRLRRRTKIPAPILRPADLRPADLIAKEALDALEREYPGGNGIPRAFYFRLSAVLRDYLDNRYALPALERTTREILREIRKENLDPEETAVLRDILSRCDLVKFRGTEPERSDAGESLRGARGFVEKTREKGPETPGGAA